jgi:hypothetical protein
MGRMLSHDDVDNIVIEAACNGDHRRAALRFEDLAERRDLHGIVNRAMLLVDAGGQYDLANDWQAAVRCYRAAVADGGKCSIDPRLWLFGSLTRLGRVAEADEVLEQLRERRGTDTLVYQGVAETLEAEGRLEQAHTWFTLGFFRCEEADVPMDREVLSLLLGRHRVRGRLGLPPDRLDGDAEEYLAAGGYAGYPGSVGSPGSAG